MGLLINNTKQTAKDKPGRKIGFVRIKKRLKRKKKKGEKIAKTIWSFKFSVTLSMITLQRGYIMLKRNR